MLRPYVYTPSIERALKQEESPVVPRDFAAEQLAESVWRGQPEWVIRAEMERRIDRYSKRRRIRQFDRWVRNRKEQMNDKFKKAAESHGGRHAKAVKRVGERIAAAGTEADRLKATVEATIENLQGMLAEGASTEDFMDALDHLQANRDTLTHAIKHGL